MALRGGLWFAMLGLLVNTAAVVFFGFGVLVEGAFGSDRSFLFVVGVVAWLVSLAVAAVIGMTRGRQGHGRRWFAGAALAALPLVVVWFGWVLAPLYGAAALCTPAPAKSSAHGVSSVRPAARSR